MNNKFRTTNHNQQLSRAIALHQSGKFSEAVSLYKKLLNYYPRNITILNNLGAIDIQNSKLQTGIEFLEKSIAINPNQYDAHFNKGVALFESKRLTEAIVSFDKAIENSPNSANAYTNRGNTLKDLKRLEESLASYNYAISLNPYDANIYNNRGNVLRDLKLLDQALASYDVAIQINPGHGDAYNNRGCVLQEIQRLEDALANYEHAISLRPNYAMAHNNRGNVLRDLGRLNEAVSSYDLAIEIDGKLADAYSNKGLLLQDLNRLDEALNNYRLAIEVDPNFAEGHLGRANVLKDLGRLEEALTSYDRAIELKPDLDYIFGHKFHTKMSICNWEAFGDFHDQLTDKIMKGEKAAVPFAVQAIIDDPEILKINAEAYVKNKTQFINSLSKIKKYNNHERIRIGYFSSDFRNHAVSALTAELYEKHDRSKFEVIAFSFGIDDKDTLRKRLEIGFDRFIDVKNKSDKDITLLSREMEIDIAIDLGGLTAGSRTGIFALRAAPIQVSYIGYLGTMGAEYMDYLIADRTIIPDEYQQFYSEKIAYLPSYQVNDSKRHISSKEFTRQELGLPCTGFVFCCFNNTYKITPSVFDTWMQILKQVKGSVLFLYANNEISAVNLKREAVLRGIDAERLVFGGRLPDPDYLARYRVADLFLDTLPYNAGTTASDALRVGLPVLTRIGKSFASRVAASLLNAVNLPELITSTKESYESLAIELARDPLRLNKIKKKLIENLGLAPLYKTDLFTEHIESAYIEMYRRYQIDLPPEHIYIAPKLIQK